MAILEERVLSIHHWTDKTFSFKTTRNQGFRFKNGEFAMIGLKIDEKPLLRAYSIASANHEDHLEFLSIKVPNGPLTSKLQHIKIDDNILINSKSTGTLVCDYLLPGKNLYLFSTGTGLAPFMSIIRDPETYEKFEKVILTHTVRVSEELAYKDLLENLNQCFTPTVIDIMFTYQEPRQDGGSDAQDRWTWLSMVYQSIIFLLTRKKLYV